MKSFFRQIPRPSLTIVIILLTSAVLLACGPATQSSPSEQPVSQPVQEKSTPEPTNTPEPTPLPTDVITRRADGGYNEILAEPPPKPTPKYPGIRNSQLQEAVVELEATKEAHDQSASGTSGPRQAVDDPVVDVTVYLTANTLTVAEWVRNQGITTVHVREYEDGSGGQFSASMPTSLLGALANQEGVREIDPLREVRVDKE